jgi:cytochrome c
VTGRPGADRARIAFAGAAFVGVALVAASLLGSAAFHGARAAEAEARGRRAFQKCLACHSVESGETNLPGPNLAGILGRPIAAEPGFAYSDGLRDLALREGAWRPDLLDRFLQAPEDVAPGTYMGFLGLGEDERRSLVAFLGATRAGP